MIQGDIVHYSPIKLVVCCRGKRKEQTSECMCELRPRAAPLRWHMMLGSAVMCTRISEGKQGPLEVMGLLEFFLVCRFGRNAHADTQNILTFLELALQGPAAPHEETR